MPITAPDLVFVASERMIDKLSTTTGLGGGGRRGSTVVQDGVDNNVFPDVMPADLVTGRLQARLVYPSVLSAGADQLSNAQACVLNRPTSSVVEVCAFTAASIPEDGVSPNSWVDLTDTDRAKSHYAVAHLQAPAYNPAASMVAFTHDNANPNRLLAVSGHSFVVGDKIVQAEATAAPGTRFVQWRTVTAISAGAWIEFSGSDPFTGTEAVNVRPAVYSNARRVSAPALTTASSSIGATSLAIDRVEVQVIPTGANSANAASIGLATSEFLALTSGKLPAFVAGDLVLVQHASVLTTWEMAQVDHVDFLGNLTLAAPLANAYASGSRVTALMPLGDLVAGVEGTPFAQQLWNRVWADTVVGPAIGANYSLGIGVSNEGTVTDRWAVVFRTATAYDLLSERLGQIASGSTTTDFLPLNPMTSEPFFTLYSGGWGSGWQAGNVLRFNTRAAAAGLWVVRCTSPGTLSGTDQATLALRGDIDA